MAFADVFKPKWKSSRKDVRIEAIKKIDKTDILQSIICQESDMEVQEVAYITLLSLMSPEKILSDCESMIQNNKELEELVLFILLHEDSFDLKQKAVRLITNQKKIISLLEDSRLVEALKIILIGNLEDQKALKNIVVNSNSYDLRIAALEKIEDKDFILEVASNDKVYSVREKAICYYYGTGCLDDNCLKAIDAEKFKEDIVFNGDDFSKRKVIKFISDVPLLKKIIIDNKIDVSTRLSACDMIDESAFFQESFSVISDKLLKKRFIKKVDSLDFLNDIIVSNDEHSIVECAIYKKYGIDSITDDNLQDITQEKELLYLAIKGNLSPKQRRWIIENKINKEESFKLLITRSSNTEDILLAIDYINDKDFLIKIYEEQDNAKVRIKASNQLKKQTLAYLQDKLLIEPLYDGCGKFREGLCRIKEKGCWGFINMEGEIIISPKYSDCHDFSEGLAAVRLNDKWGYIDQYGKIVIDLVFDQALDFSDNMASVVVDGKWGIIKK